MRLVFFALPWPHWPSPALRRRPLPRTASPSPVSSRRPPAPASTASTPASGNTWSAVASPRSTATATASTTCCWPAALRPPNSTATPAREAARCGSRRDQRARAGQGDGRLSARRRQRRQYRSGAVARRRKRRDARPRRLPFRARQRSLGFRWRRCLVDCPCRDLGTWRGLADDRDRQLHQPSRGDVAVGVVHRQLVAPARWWSTTKASGGSPRRCR